MTIFTPRMKDLIDENFVLYCIQSFINERICTYNTFRIPSFFKYICHSSPSRFIVLLNILTSEDGARIELAWSRASRCLFYLRPAATRPRREFRFPHLWPSLMKNHHHHRHA